MPGVRARPEQGRQSQRSQGPGGWRVARSLAAGAAGSQQVDGAQAAMRGLRAVSLKPYVPDLEPCYHHCSCGPLVSGRKGHQGSLVQERSSHPEIARALQPRAPHIEPSSHGHTALCREARISRRGLGPSRRVPGCRGHWAQSSQRTVQ